MRSRWWLLIAFAIFLAIALVFVGCGKDDEEEIPEQPVLPPTGTFNSVDFNLFLNPDSIFNPSVKSLERCADFDTAAFIVSISCAVINLVFIWPELAFALAMTQNPTYEGDLTWRWTFGADSNNISLYAQLVSDRDSVDWTMRVTNSHITDFRWFFGRCNFEATGGWWQLNDVDSSNAEVPTLWLGWSRQPDDTAGSVTIVNIDESDEGYGDTISYWRDGLISNADLKIHHGDRPGRWQITWHSQEYWGTVIYPEGRQGCWDDSLECVDCDSLDLPAK